jgi:hypothetical protein
MGAWRAKHVEWLWRNKTCTVLHQVGVLFDLERERERELRESNNIKTDFGVWILAWLIEQVKQFLLFPYYIDMSQDGVSYWYRCLKKALAADIDMSKGGIS